MGYSAHSRCTGCCWEAQRCTAFRKCMHGVLGRGCCRTGRETDRWNVRPMSALWHTSVWLVDKPLATPKGFIIPNSGRFALFAGRKSYAIHYSYHRHSVDFRPRWIVLLSTLSRDQARQSVPLESLTRWRKNPMQLTVRAVSKLLKVPEKTVYRWIEQDDLPAGLSMGITVSTVAN